MIQNWNPQGVAFNKTFAQCPTVLEFDNFWRIYYTNRDNANRSQIYFVDVEPENPNRLIKQHTKPLLPLGLVGSGDSSGTMATSILKHNKQIYLYYIGWSQRRDVPYNNQIFLAISDDNGENFKKEGPGPIISTSKEDPYFVGTFNVIKEYSRGFVFFRGYYLSCTEWKNINGNLEPTYLIKYTDSSDGISWKMPGHNVINYKHENEAICNASVLKTLDNYQMWYCHRNIEDYKSNKKNSYKIGYAESNHAKGPWVRKDELIKLQTDGIMAAYPNVIKCGKKLFMFYNTDFGSSGIYYATFEISSDKTQPTVPGQVDQIFR